jgi:hypothetical protein
MGWSISSPEGANGAAIPLLLLKTPVELLNGNELLFGGKAIAFGEEPPHKNLPTNS